jgi:tetratricopeptide (TPR) repeat protein
MKLKKHILILTLILFVLYFALTYYCIYKSKHYSNLAKNNGSISYLDTARKYANTAYNLQPWNKSCQWRLVDTYLDLAYETLHSGLYSECTIFCLRGHQLSKKFNLDGFWSRSYGKNIFFDYLAKAYYLQNDLAKVISVYKLAVREYPNLYEAYFRLVSCHA